MVDMFSSRPKPCASLSLYSRNQTERNLSIIGGWLNKLKFWHLDRVPLRFVPEAPTPYPDGFFFIKASWVSITVIFIVKKRNKSINGHVIRLALCWPQLTCLEVCTLRPAVGSCEKRWLHRKNGNVPPFPSSSGLSLWLIRLLLVKPFSQQN